MKQVIFLLCCQVQKDIQKRVFPSKHSSWWRLSSFVFVFRRRVDEDEYVRLSLTSSEDVFKTSWSTPIYSSWPYVFKISCQDVFKTSSKRLQDVMRKVFKISSRHLQDVFQRYLQDVFKTYHQVSLLLLTRLWEAFNTFLRRLSTKGYV